MSVVDSNEFPNNLGTILFDENNNLIECTGICENKVENIPELAEVQLDNNGYGVVKSNDLIIYLYKKNGQTLVIYTTADLQH